MKVFALAILSFSTIGLGQAQFQFSVYAQNVPTTANRGNTDPIAKVEIDGMKGPLTRYPLGRSAGVQSQNPQWPELFTFKEYTVGTRDWLFISLKDHNDAVYKRGKPVGFFIVYIDDCLADSEKCVGDFLGIKLYIVPKGLQPPIVPTTTTLEPATTTTDKTRSGPFRFKVLARNIPNSVNQNFYDPLVKAKVGVFKGNGAKILLGQTRPIQGQNPVWPELYTFNEHVLGNGDRLSITLTDHNDNWTYGKTIGSCRINIDDCLRNASKCVGDSSSGKVFIIPQQ